MVAISFKLKDISPAREGNPLMKPKPKERIFIASSTEGLGIANAVQTGLQDSFQPTVWDQNFFTPSGYALDDLVTKLKDYEYAVVVLSPDDKVTSRGKVASSPRDNLLLEAGVAFGVLGREHVYLLLPERPGLKMPSDLLGLTTLRYIIREDKNYLSAVQSACTQIKSAATTHWMGAASKATAITWPIELAIVSGDASGVRRLLSALRPYRYLVRATAFGTVAMARDFFATQHVDGAFVDVFSLANDEGINLILYTRSTHAEVGLVLYGTFQELAGLQADNRIWPQTLQHFWRMPKDANPESFAITLEDMLISLVIYRLSAGTFGQAPGETLRDITSGRLDLRRSHSSKAT
jgi:predicted nucleotide-binding protein